MPVKVRLLPDAIVSVMLTAPVVLALPVNVVAVVEMLPLF